MSKFGKKPLIFLDMDGVIADFMQSALRLHFGDEWQDKLDVVPRGVFDCYEHMGLTTNTFWDTINKAGIDFWASLQKFPWTDELIRGCQELGDVCILSSPSRHTACIAGKLLWLKRVFGKNFRDYIFAPTQHKRLLAAPNRFLVEDKEDTAKNFVKDGGSGAVVIPQHWNTLAILPSASVAPIKLHSLEAMICRVR